jgi:hypothetical protein
MESPGTKVYVGNCEGISEGELRDEFSRYGHLENVSGEELHAVHIRCVLHRENTKTKKIPWRKQILSAACTVSEFTRRNAKTRCHNVLRAGCSTVFTALNATNNTGLDSTQPTWLRIRLVH